MSRAVFLPMTIYLGITLLVPLLNGASSGSGFWRHASEVVAIATAMAALRLGSGALLRVRGPAAK